MGPEDKNPASRANYISGSPPVWLAGFAHAHHPGILPAPCAPRFQELVDLGAHPASSPAEAAERSDIIFTMVGTPVDVESVVAGPEGTLAGLSTGGMTVDMTTSCPTLAIRLAELAAQQGKVSIDAPVTGGDVGAQNGTLSIFLGGKATDCLLLEPVLDSMATTVNRFGDAGAGQQAKLANQIGIASQVQPHTAPIGEWDGGGSS